MCLEEERGWNINGHLKGGRETCGWHGQVRKSESETDWTRCMIQNLHVWSDKSQLPVAAEGSWGLRLWCRRTVWCSWIVRLGTRLPLPTRSVWLFRCSSPPLSPPLASWLKDLFRKDTEKDTAVKIKRRISDAWADFWQYLALLLFPSWTGLVCLLMVSTHKHL